jgi:hypothetical protein
MQTIFSKGFKFLRNEGHFSGLGVFDSGEESMKYSSCQRGQRWFKWPLGKNTLHPPKIVFTSIAFCIWFFCVSINITS